MTLYTKPQREAMREGHLLVACENYNFIWTKEDLREFRKMWRHGSEVGEIADFFDRKEEEIAFLILDQVYRQAIKPRPEGITIKTQEKKGWRQ